MTLAELRAELHAAHETRASKLAEAEAIVAAAATDGDDGRHLTDEEAELVRSKTDEAKTIRDEKIPALEQRVSLLEEQELSLRHADVVANAIAQGATQTRTRPQGGVTIVREPGTYHRGGQHSYFRDLAFSRREIGDDLAMERLNRHVEEVRTDLGQRGIELRTNMNRTDGTGGEFVPPIWLVDQYVALARAGRVTADLFRKYPLPPGTDTINLPKIATGSTTAAQTEGSAASNTDMTTSTVTGSVKTIAGQQVFSLQLLEQSPINFDEVVFQDLIADYATRVDVGCITGTGSGANLKGIFAASVAGVNTTYTDASPTPQEIYPKIGDTIQQMHTNRYLAPQCMVMHPRRWQWFLVSLDNANRPLAIPNPQGPQNAMAAMGDVRAEGAVGSLLGLPVYVDANTPTTTGGGTEDRIFILRPDDLFLYEGDLRTRVLFETDANTLQVRLQVYAYVATIVDRYSYSVGIVGGASGTTSTGMNAPVF